MSCYFQKNYGSALQSLATQMALDRLGIPNETINTAGIDPEIRRRKVKYFAKASLTSDLLLSKYGMAVTRVRRKLVRDDYAMLSRERSIAFEHFAKEHFRLSPAYADFEELRRQTRRNYSAVLVGSDQLWLPANIMADYYTLRWVPRQVNSIAYATSFGQSSLPADVQKRAEVFLPKIRHISVREESGQRLVRELSGRKVPVVCDPTLLFTGEEWMSVQQKDPIVREPYILCYFLGNNPPHREFAKRLREATGMKIVALVHLDEYVESDNHYADATPYNIDPGDFLNLIRNASYVCTDSFHCSVFSILYGREFFSFRRYARKTSASTNSRLDTLFHLCGIEGRQLEGDESISECLKIQTDFAKVQGRLAGLRESSYQYLKDSIADERSTDRD